MRSVQSSRVGEHRFRSGVSSFQAAFQGMWEADGCVDYATGLRATPSKAPLATSASANKGVFGYSSHNTRSRRSSESVTSAHRAVGGRGRKAALLEGGMRLGEALAFTSLSLPVQPHEGPRAAVQESPRVAVTPARHSKQAAPQATTCVVACPPFWPFPLPLSSSLSEWVLLCVPPSPSPPSPLLPTQKRRVGDARARTRYP